MSALDLFAGPGGWDVGARELGIDPLGIEWDEAACATREAAGLATVRADVAALTPSDFAPIDLLIASPPCQAWSMAGKRAGERDQEHVYTCTDELARGIDRRAEHRGACEDERSILVVEPVRWALALRPRFIACEQVPPVLDYWRHVAYILETEGYRTWTGILSAERYGVPQTRKRAILMARLDGPVYPPAPTHQGYRPGEPAWDAPQLTLEGEVQPWVSMAEALGWGMTAAGRWEFRKDATTGERDDRPPRRGDEPAPTLTEKARSAKCVLVNNAQARRDEDEPAPTITAQPGRHGVKRRERPAGQRRDSGPGAEREPRSTEEPSYTIRANGSGSNPAGIEWVENRPATANYQPGDDAVSQGNPGGSTVRVTQEEAAVLQGFPADYPWQGSRTKQFQQIGNAVPPPLARAVLAALTESAGELREAA